MTAVTASSAIKKLSLIFLMIGGLYLAKDFLIPLSIAGMLATLFLPLCKWIERKKMPRSLAVFVCMIVLISALSSIGFMLGWQITELANDIAIIKERTLASAEKIQQYIFDHFGITRSEQTQIIKNQQATLTTLISSMAGSLTAVFTNLVIVLMYVFLLLYYRTHLKNFILKFSTRSNREATEEMILRSTHVSQQYLLGMSKMIVLLWVMYGIGFSWLGVKNALFFAILCGLLEIIPYIGIIIGNLLTVLVSIVNGADVSLVLGILVVYGSIQLFQGWVLEPLILGPQVKINPLFTIVAIVLGELIWGIPGIILAIPLTAIVKIVCDHIESLKPYGFLIGEIDNKSVETSNTQKV
jgi:predicted PurR-regulated permease PerM